MTEEQRVMVGQFCDELLAHPLWQLLNYEFEQDTVADLLNTIPPAHSEREGIYFTYNGYRSFVAHMKALVRAKNQILEQRDLEALSDTDEPTEDL